MIRATALMLAACPATADTLVAARTLPAMSIITEADLILRDDDIPGGVSDPALIIGMEAKVALYAGRPIRAGDVGYPAVVARNQIVPMVFDAGGIRVSTEGRALDRAGPGEIIRVMNLTSRNTVSAVIGADGVAYVSR